MAKQTYTTGQVLTAAQMTTLQNNDFNQTVSAKTASYTLVAADAGTRITMSNASATTVTVNTNLFTAGDTLQITNIGAGVCTITAGTATVSTAGVLTLAQNASGTLYFTSTGVSIFNGSVAAAGGGKVLQVVMGTTATTAFSSTSTLVTTNLSQAITPTLNTSKVLVLVSQAGCRKSDANSQNALTLALFRDSTNLVQMALTLGLTATAVSLTTTQSYAFLDSPATTSSTTYSTKFASFSNAGQVLTQANTESSTIVLLEIGA